MNRLVGTASASTGVIAMAVAARGCLFTAGEDIQHDFPV